MWTYNKIPSTNINIQFLDENINLNIDNKIENNMFVFGLTYSMQDKLYMSHIYDYFIYYYIKIILIWVDYFIQ